MSVQHRKATGAGGPQLHQLHKVWILYTEGRVSQGAQASQAPLQGRTKGQGWRCVPRRARQRETPDAPHTLSPAASVLRGRGAQGAEAGDRAWIRRRGHD